MKKAFVRARRLRSLMALCLLALCLLLPACARGEEEELAVTFFDAGKADAILVRAGEHALLIDAGLNKNGEELAEAIRAAGVERLDLLLITHFDKDHVGGADAVLAGLPVDEVLQPDYFKDSKQMDQYRRALREAGLTPTVLDEDQTRTLGRATLSIDVANADDYGAEEENDFSLVVSLCFGQTRFLFAGDAEEARIAELLEEGDLAHDVLKAPHHGRAHDNNAEFFGAVGAQFAVITSADDEREDPETVRLLEQTGATVLLTRLGTVTIRSDGVRLTVEQEPAGQ